MEEETPLTTHPPHVLIFPLPLQGPVNCMLKLAELLCLHDLHVTFLNTEHIHQRLLRYSNVESYFKRYPNFNFGTIPDGLSDNNSRTMDQISNLINSMEEVTKPLLMEMVTSGSLGKNSNKPLSCIVADGIFCFAVDIAREIKVPLLFFDTISPCGLWTYLCVPKLIETGELPFSGDSLDEPIKNVPGMEGILRRRDLPSFCRTKDINIPLIKLVLKEDEHLPLSQGLILNTFDDLENPIISQLQTISLNVYAIGPLHSHLKSKLSSSKPPTSSNIFEEDKSCMAWLDMQPPNSVVYVSIGSLAVMTKKQLIEIWYGLVNSGSRFLWVQRLGSITEPEDELNEVPLDLFEATRERGLVVSWAPQELVLGHEAIGGFFTHSGWNSTLESLVAGVPMICWPYVVDQQVNSRYVEEVWKLGLDMKDTCDRKIVERMIREVMVTRRYEFKQMLNRMAKLAQDSVSDGGSSYHNLNRLIKDIKMMRFRL
ncbi:transferase [Lithospermum erythrorhizon]|uniref:Glycosyltransferase n=1 Tax=Lithospermum erythrorhizon TaxID=34254 RepID=A0AAV3Q7J6_LITER